VADNFNLSNPFVCRLCEVRSEPAVDTLLGYVLYVNKAIFSLGFRLTSGVKGVGENMA